MISKAPWKFHKNKIGHGRAHTIEDADGNAVCVSFFTGRCGEKRLHRIDNENLIAVAPEMYEDEKENLEFLQMYFESTKNLSDLMLNDSDVKATFQLNEKLKNMHSSLLKNMGYVELIISQKIQKTADVLKKARGEE